MIVQAVILRSVWESVCELFETMIPLSVERDDDAAEGGPCSSVLRSITFMGQLQGVFALLCGLETADKTARTMLTMGPDENPDEPAIFDALGKVVNMLLGCLCSKDTPTLQSLAQSLSLSPAKMLL
jgi:hypothetical protein